jgi:ribonuclease E
LPSGGSIVVDPTEALVAIDVNSGRSTAEEDPEATALATNLEAVAEVARQLRLRDLGGLVVLDLIDMRERRAERRVERALKDAFARDRARIRVGRIGPFGCLILSRQRIRQALSRVTHEDCPTCGGTGRRRHPAGLGLRVLREMQARTARARGRGGLEVRVPEAVLQWLKRHRGAALQRIRKSLSGPVHIQGDERLPLDGWAMKGLPPTDRAEPTGQPG